jgi:hypothetical protein
MPAFSAFIPETHSNVSPGFVDILIRTQREELFTGLMELRQPSNETFVIIFVDGVEQKLYRCREHSTEIIQRADWSRMISHSEATVGILSLSLEALRFIQVAYEVPVTRVDQLRLKSQELLEHASRWLSDSDPSILQVRIDTVNRWYLFADRSSSVLEEITVANDNFQFSISDPLFAQSFPDGEHEVTRYISNREYAAWQEYELRLAFNPFIRMLMKRFSELAGRVLTERLCEQLSAWARTGGWNIVISSNGAINHQYFDTLEAAVSAYTDILRRFHSEVLPAVGSRLAENIFRETLMKLPPNFGNILNQYIYKQHGLGSTLLIAHKEDKQL